MDFQDCASDICSSIPFGTPWNPSHKQNNAEATGLSAVRSSRGHAAERGPTSDPHLERLAKSSDKNAARASQSFLQRSGLTLDVPISNVEVGAKPFDTSLCD